MFFMSDKGWYFEDEGLTVGPYATRVEAVAAFISYLKRNGEKYEFV